MYWLYHDLACFRHLHIFYGFYTSECSFVSRGCIKNIFFLHSLESSVLLSDTHLNIERGKWKSARQQNGIQFLGISIAFSFMKRTQAFGMQFQLCHHRWEHRQKLETYLISRQITKWWKLVTYFTLKRNFSLSLNIGLWSTLLKHQPFV